MNDYRAFFKLLDELGIASNTVEHEAVLTAEGLAQRDTSKGSFPSRTSSSKTRADSFTW